MRIGTSPMIYYLILVKVNVGQKAIKICIFFLIIEHFLGSLKIPNWIEFEFFESPKITNRAGNEPNKYLVLDVGEHIKTNYHKRDSKAQRSLVCQVWASFNNILNVLYYLVGLAVITWTIIIK